jgi:hypothetical protein
MNDTSGIMRELHDDYAEQVNLAVAEGRDDVIEVLAARFAAAREPSPPAQQQRRMIRRPGEG